MKQLMPSSVFRHVGSVFWKRRPIQLTCFLTRRCNAQCPYCFYLAHQSKQPAPAQELSASELELVSRSLGSLLWLAFSGGEIFLRRDLADIVAAFYDRNRPAIILLPSNGLDTQTVVATTETILRRCPGSTIVVKLSLDGPAHIHDAARGQVGSFERTMRTCTALGELLEEHPHFELGINSVLTQANREHLPGFLDQTQGWPQVRTHTVSLLRGRTWQERPEGLERIVSTYEALTAVMEHRLRNKVAATYRFRGSRLKAAQDNLQRRLILRTAVEGRRLLSCYAGRLNLALTEGGDLYPCESFGPEMLLGNIRQASHDLRAVLRTPQARRVLAGIARGQCHCTHECYMMTNILFNPRLYPQLLLEYLRT